jgi:hypothetical protein
MSGDGMMPKIIGWYVILNDEQVAWHHDMKKAMQHARAIGGKVQAEYEDAA